MAQLAGEREHETVNDCFLRGNAEPNSDPGRDHRRGAYLEESAQGNLFENILEAFERKLQPDGEEQKHHPDLGDYLDGLNVTCQRETVWPLSLIHI